VAWLDFAGLSSESPLPIYAALAVVLLVVAALARRRQLTARSVTR
jgi:MYXO-CTERM domain-containing protein